MSPQVEIATSETGGRLVVVVRGELQATACRKLAERILAGDAGEVVLDVTAADIEDRALGALSRLIEQHDRKVDVRGLRERQIRLLEWLVVQHA